MWRSMATATLGGAIAAVLALLRPHPAALCRRLTTPGSALQQAGPDVVLAEVSATLLWIVAAWLAVGIAAALLACVPGWVGRVSGAASRRMLPAALRRVVAGSAGLGVLLAPLPAAFATSAGPAPKLAAATLPAPVWPGAPERVGRPDPSPATEHPKAEHPKAPHADVEHPVRVQPGDSLWLIAARRLGPTADPAQVAASWPRWYAANRHVIGADPDLIRPGQLLSPPHGVHADGPQR
jgi:nucleoid-associated protein YgaU